MDSSRDYGRNCMKGLCLKKLKELDEKHPHEFLKKAIAVIDQIE